MICYNDAEEITMKRKLVTFDWAMKKLLRSKANFDILEGFLSELLKEDIKILEILESESNQEQANDKCNRVDIKAKNSANEIIIIEIQNEREKDYFHKTLEEDYFHRTLYGTSKVITEHMLSGTAYVQVVKVISVNIIYFDLGEGEDYVYHGTTVFKGMHKHDVLGLSAHQKKLYNRLTVKDIYPEYYLLQVKHFDDKSKDTLDEWIYFLKNGAIKTDFTAKGIQKAQKTLDIMQLSDKQRLEYEKFQDNLHYQASMFHSNYEVGMLEGIKEGREKSKAIGIEKGKTAAKIEIAKNLLDVLDVETIAEITGLSIAEIKKLIKLYELTSSQLGFINDNTKS